VVKQLQILGLVIIVACSAFLSIQCSNKQNAQKAEPAKQAAASPQAAQELQVIAKDTSPMPPQEQPEPPPVVKKHKKVVAVHNTEDKNVAVVERVIAKAETLSAPNVLVAIDLPAMAEPGDTVVINASGSKDPLDPSFKLLYRMDVDGDKVFDYPNSGFDEASIVNHVFDKEGIYHVIVEAQGKSGRVGRAEAKMMIRIPPTATITIDPPLPVAGTVCTLDASKSTVSALGKKSFIVRWDMDDNGTWDKPAKGFTTALTALKKLDGPGPFRVALLIKDETGLTAKAVAEIPMTPVFKVILVSFPDTALTDVPFTATCQTSYPPAQIAEYDWDFLGTGKPNVQSEKQEHSYTYTKSGTYKVTCKAIARNGNTSQLTKQIVVVSRNVKVKARAPLTAQALVPVEFDGEIQANRTKVDQVAWDYDGDNVFDWTGPSL
jgi:PKD repeat protein